MFGRGRRCRRGRPLKFRAIAYNYGDRYFSPVPLWTAVQPEVVIFFDELEALRLVDMEGLSQEEAGNRMNVSRGTIWRLVSAARKKIVTALVENRPIRITQRAVPPPKEIKE